MTNLALAPLYHCADDNETLAQEITLLAGQINAGNHRLLMMIAEHFLATTDQNAQLQGLKGSERCQVVLHVDINTLRKHSPANNPAHEHCHLEDKLRVSAKTARRLSCDASLITVLDDEQGRVLNIGRKARTVPANISRALRLRDQTCRFPGCCDSKHVDAHHIKHWAEGGETSLDNLVTLCRHHHRALHRGSYSIRVENTAAEQRLVFSTPSGRQIETSIFPQFTDVSAETFESALTTIAPAVNPKTAVTKWRGEECDYSMAVGALLARDGRL